MTPHEALHTATATAARVIRVGDEVTTIDADKHRPRHLVADPLEQGHSAYEA